MGNLFAIVAFVLLWLVLVGFFFGLLRVLSKERRARRRGEGAGWEHGL